MPTDKVCMVAKYKHDATGEVMNLIAASTPLSDDHVLMWEHWPKPESGFNRCWVGTWNEFCDNWTGPLED